MNKKALLFLGLSSVANSLASGAFPDLGSAFLMMGLLWIGVFFAWPLIIDSLLFPFVLKQPLSLVFKRLIAKNSILMIFQFISILFILLASNLLASLLIDLHMPVNVSIGVIGLCTFLLSFFIGFRAYRYFFPELNRPYVMGVALVIQSIPYMHVLFHFALNIVYFLARRTY